MSTAVVSVMSANVLFYCHGFTLFRYELFKYLNKNIIQSATNLN